LREFHPQDLPQVRRFAEANHRELWIKSAMNVLGNEANLKNQQALTIIAPPLGMSCLILFPAEERKEEVEAFRSQGSQADGRGHQEQLVGQVGMQ
jgi:hypothetical protein